MNSRRSFKLNLPNVPKPSKLLAPTRLCQTFVFSNLTNPAIRSIASTKPHQLLLAIPRSFLSSKTLSTLWIDVGCIWVQISSQILTMREGWRRGYNDFSLRMSSSFSKRFVCVCCRKPIKVFSLYMAFFTFVGNENIYSIGEG